METNTHGLNHGDILCAVVLLKCQAATGKMSEPLSVRMCITPESKERAWFDEACKYLHQVYSARQAQKVSPIRAKTVRTLSAREWEQLSEDLR